MYSFFSLSFLVAVALVLSGLCLPMLEAKGASFVRLSSFFEAESNEYDYMHYS